MSGRSASRAAVHVAIVVAAAVLWAAPVSAETRWLNFYGAAPLDHTARATTPDIRSILQEDLPRLFVGDERARLGGVTIQFPREDGAHPANFYSIPSARRIVVPVSSLRFLRDVVASYAWLSVQGYDLQPVTDYLGLIKYQWPARLQGVPHTPMEVLGVPANALDDRRVASRFQQLFGTMVVFVLGHELGHIYHQHGAYAAVSPDAARRQEQEADAFALSLAQRLGEAPVGTPLFFHVMAHLESFAGDPDFRQDRANRTHPLSTSRLEAVAAHMERNADRFAARAGGARAVTTIAQELRKVATILADESTQQALRRIGLSASVESLTPRRVGDLPRLPGEESAPPGIFSGRFVGKWTDAKGNDLDVRMVLVRQGEAVNGAYVLFTTDGTGRRHAHGSGALTMKGTLRDGVLDYEWTWGPDYFGRGRLRAEDGGHVMSGTWGYTRAPEGAGTWQLKREPR
jgi:hypothetical protein